MKSCEYLTFLSIKINRLYREGPTKEKVHPDIETNRYILSPSEKPHL